MDQGVDAKTEVTIWLEKNDEKDDNGNLVLGNVIGKYASFEHITVIYSNAQELKERFNIRKYGHVVAPLLLKLNEYWQSGM